MKNKIWGHIQYLYYCYKFDIFFILATVIACFLAYNISTKCIFFEHNIFYWLHILLNVISIILLITCICYYVVKFHRYYKCLFCNKLVARKKFIYDNDILFPSLLHSCPNCGSYEISLKNMPRYDRLNMSGFLFEIKNRYLNKQLIISETLLQSELYKKSTPNTMEDKLCKVMNYFYSMTSIGTAINICSFSDNGMLIDFRYTPETLYCINFNELNLVLEQMQKEGFISILKRENGNITKFKITATGIDFVKKLELENDVVIFNNHKKNNNGAMVVNQKIENIYGANSQATNIYGNPDSVQIQQGTAYSNQTQIKNNEFDYQKVQEIINEIKKNINNIGLDTVKLNKLDEIISEIEPLIITKSDPSKIKSLLCDIKNLAIGVSGSLIASGIVAVIQQFLK